MSADRIAQDFRAGRITGAVAQRLLAVRDTSHFSLRLDGNPLEGQQQ